MDLTNLRDSLDSSSRERHPASASAKRSELRLTRDFKAAAFQLTTLYKTSLSSAKRSYAAGYAQSLADVLDVVQLRMQQHPATAPGSRFNGASTSAMGASAMAEAEREELHWLVRYLRARLEAIMGESEDDDEIDMTEDEEEATTPVDKARSTAARERSDSASTVNAQQSAGSTSSSHARQGSNASAATSRGQGRATRSRSPSAASETTEPNSATAAAPAFTFTASAPSTSASRSANRATKTAGSARARRARQNDANRAAASTPPRLPRAASSDEDETTVTPTSRHGSHATSRRSMPNTPSSLGGSAQSSPVSTPANTPGPTRLGKRRGGTNNGRERLSNLELFGRAMSAKRRRHLGDDRQGGPDDGSH